MKRVWRILLASDRVPHTTEDYPLPIGHILRFFLLCTYLHPLKVLGLLCQHNLVQATSNTIYMLHTKSSVDSTPGIDSFIYPNQPVHTTVRICTKF